jgi:hypothetical protein
VVPVVERLAVPVLPEDPPRDFAISTAAAMTSSPASTRISGRADERLREARRPGPPLLVRRAAPLPGPGAPAAADSASADSTAVLVTGTAAG